MRYFLLLFATLLTVSLAVPLEANAQSVYSATGKASWFGRWHHGKLTACGDKFDMYAMTAAHKTLPFGTILRVTNLSNNMEVLVRINDRGPYRPGRILDLYYGAAGVINMQDTGVAPIKIEAVGSVEGMPLDAEQAFFVRLATISEAISDRALAYMSGLIRVGLYDAPALLHTAGETMMLGPFESFQDAQTALSRVSTTHPQASIILSERNAAKPVVEARAEAPL